MLNRWSRVKTRPEVGATGVSAAEQKCHTHPGMHDLHVLFPCPDGARAKDVRPERMYDTDGTRTHNLCHIRSRKATPYHYWKGISEGQTKIILGGTYGHGARRKVFPSYRMCIL